MLRRAAAGCALAVALLAGCTSHGDPKPSATPSGPAPSASPTRTGPLTTGPGVRPGERPPVESDLAKQHTPDGAYVFAAYFIRAVDWSIATNDTYLITRISAPSCTACTNYVKEFAELRRRGESQRGGRLAVKTQKVVTGTFKVKSDYVFEFQLDQSSAIVTGSATPSVIATDQEQTVPSLVFVSWLAGRWQVLEQGAPS